MPILSSLTFACVFSSTLVEKENSGFFQEDPSTISFSFLEEETVVGGHGICGVGDGNPLGTSEFGYLMGVQCISKRFDIADDIQAPIHYRSSGLVTYYNTIVKV